MTDETLIELGEEEQLEPRPDLANARTGFLFESGRKPKPVRVKVVAIELNLLQAIQLLVILFLAAIPAFFIALIVVYFVLAAIGVSLLPH